VVEELEYVVGCRKKVQRGGGEVPNSLIGRKSAGIGGNAEVYQVGSGTASPVVLTAEDNSRLRTIN
jgi:hypothetical protein